MKKWERKTLTHLTQQRGGKEDETWEFLMTANEKFNPGASKFLIFSTFLSISHGTWLFVSVLWHGNCTEKKLDVIKYVNGFPVYFFYIFS